MSTQVKRTHESVSNQIKKRSEWGRQVGIKDEQRWAWGKTLNQRYRLNERTHENVEYSVGKFSRKGARRDIKRINMKLGAGWKSPPKFNRVWPMTSSRPNRSPEARWCRNCLLERTMDDRRRQKGCAQNYWTSRRVTKENYQEPSQPIEPAGLRSSDTRKKTKSHFNFFSGW